MKTLWKLTREAARYKGLYVIAILSTFSLTLINLSAPSSWSARASTMRCRRPRRSLCWWRIKGA